MEVIKIGRLYTADRFELLGQYEYPYIYKGKYTNNKALVAKYDDNKVYIAKEKTDTWHRDTILGTADKGEIFDNTGHKIGEYHNGKIYAPSGAYTYICDYSRIVGEYDECGGKTAALASIPLIFFSESVSSIEDEEEIKEKEWKEKHSLSATGGINQTSEGFMDWVTDFVIVHSLYTSLKSHWRIRKNKRDYILWTIFSILLFTTSIVLLNINPLEFIHANESTVLWILHNLMRVGLCVLAAYAVIGWISDSTSNVGWSFRCFGGVFSVFIRHVEAKLYLYVIEFTVVFFIGLVRVIFTEAYFSDIGDYIKSIMDVIYGDLWY